MFGQKNGASFTRTLRNVLFSGAALLALSPLSADCDLSCEEQCSPCNFDLCNWEMPEHYEVYVDFIYWQVHPEGLEFARKVGIAADAVSAVDKGRIICPDCQLEPGFRAGVVVDLGCCNWDFYAQYTWLWQNYYKQVNNPFVSTRGAGNKPLHPIIWNLALDSSTTLSEARAEWKNHFNAFDFGLGRTFSVNCCFDFRPHLGFKSTWQFLKYKVHYVDQISTNSSESLDIYNEAEFDGIGLRGGFDAAWKFSPCFSIVGGAAMSCVWSDIEVHRKDVYINGSSIKYPVNLKADRCALIPVTELLLGLRYDTTLCCCYDVFLFLGWENQVWWNLNRFLVVNDTSDDNNIQFGPHGNITYQGLTVRAGIDY